MQRDERTLRTIQCTSCHATNRATVGICASCGAALDRRCPRCQQPNPAPFRFCGHCGARLGDNAPAAPSALAANAGARERRPLTVLFCDLAGSTSLSARLDAEDLGDVIGQYFGLCKERFERHGGYVDREEGDCLRVYFGYPQSHDDDAIRAARAALDVAAAVHRLGIHLSGRTGGSLEVHIGIHTGEVVAGEIGGGGGHGPIVVGEVPNIAKRLEELALAGTVMVSAATCRLIAPGFVCEAVGPVVLKGIPKAVEAFRVVHDKGFAGAIDLLGARALAPMLGRDAEMALLERGWSSAREGSGQVLLISGEPGIGKSRVAHAFVTSVVGELHTAYVLQCQQVFCNSALFPVIELLHRHLGFTRDEAPQARREKLDAAFAAGVLPDPTAADHVAALLSLPVASTAPTFTARRQRALVLKWLTQWLLGSAATGPVALIVEDAHWADATTLEFIGAAIGQTASRHAMLLITHRPEFNPPWPPRAHVARHALARLSASEVGALVSSLTKDPASPVLIENIASRSEGVPLYVEELTHMLIDRSKLDASVLNPAQAPVADIPPTLRGSLVARLDHLEASKPVAQMAAVIGREFSYRLVRTVSGLDDDVLRRGLAELVGAGLLYRRTPPPEENYAFKHVLVQEAAYLSLLKPHRVELHARTAQALVEQDVAATNPEVVAQHFAAAGQAQAAVDHWHRAGARALEASAEVEAVAHLRQALQHLAGLPSGTEQRVREVRCLITLGSALAELRGYGATEVEETFARVYQLCEGLGDTEQLYSALTGLHAFYLVRGYLPRALECARGLIDIADRAGDALHRAQAHRCLGWALFCRGELQAGGDHLDTALSLFDRVRASEHSRIHGMHPWVAGFANSGLQQWFAGHPEEAVKRCAQARSLARELCQPLALAYALCVSAAVHTCRGEPQVTLDLVREAQEIATADGMPYWAAWAATLGGWAMAGLGRYDDGLAQLRESLDRYRATGARLFEPWSLGLLAQIHADAGRLELAMDAIESALASEMLSGGYFYTAELYRLKSELLRMSGADRDEADRWAQRAGDLVRRQATRVPRADMPGIAAV